MPKIIVASTNPVKINAALMGFQSMFPDQQFEVVGVSAASGVPDQPIGDAQTLEGAMNRVTAAIKLDEADYYVGIEGGITHIGDDVEVCAWVVVQSATGKYGKAKTGMFLLPKKLAAMVKSGIELGYASATVFQEENLKQKGGSVGILTGDAISRTAYYHHAVILALIPFRNVELY